MVVKAKDIEVLLELLRKYPWRVFEKYGLVFTPSRRISAKASKQHRADPKRFANRTVRNMSDRQFLSILPYLDKDDRIRLRRLRILLTSE